MTARFTNASNHEVFIEFPQLFQHRDRVVVCGQKLGHESAKKFVKKYVTSLERFLIEFALRKRQNEVFGNFVDRILQQVPHLLVLGTF